MGILYDQRVLRSHVGRSRKQRLKKLITQ